MKLNPIQIEFRCKFRETILNLWGKGSRISEVIRQLSSDMGLTTLELYAVAETIPSIGRLSANSSVDVWVGHNYPKVSEALFASDIRAATTLFVSKNHDPIKRSSEKSSAKYYEKKINSIRTLNAEKGDRWEKTAWNIVK